MNYTDFCHIEIPDFLQSGDWLDISWGNDITARSQYATPLNADGWELHVWVAEPDPKDREAPDLPRYMVSVYDDKGDLQSSTDCETDDEAKGAVEKVLRKYNLIS